IAVTSAMPGSGKTSLTTALGVSFASAGYRTLVIDADVTGGNLTRRLLHRQRGGGLREALDGDDLARAVRPSPASNLFVLGQGDCNRSDASLLSPAAIAQLLRKAKRLFHVILIDTGPVLGSLEAPVVAGEADAVVLVTARGEQGSVVQKAAHTLRMHAAQVAGVVFNRATPRDMHASVYHSGYSSLATSRMRSQPDRSGDEQDDEMMQTRQSLADQLNGEAAAMGPLAHAVATRTNHPAARAQLALPPSSAARTVEQAATSDNADDDNESTA
ncbi:MAG: CpsD/CapB family tyrosine-protein kinase, partial [Planctomycetota bacterium]